MLFCLIPNSARFLGGLCFSCQFDLDVYERFLDEAGMFFPLCIIGQGLFRLVCTLHISMVGGSIYLFLMKVHYSQSIFHGDFFKSYNVGITLSRSNPYFHSTLHVCSPLLNGTTSTPTPSFCNTCAIFSDPFLNTTLSPVGSLTW